MQRLIAASLIVLVLLVGGAGFGWAYRQNRSYPVFVPLKVNPDTSAAKREEIAKILKEKLSEPERLLKVSKDVGLAGKWHLASDKEAAAELSKRLFVDATDTTINIGVHGKKKEKAVSGEIVTRLMEDVKEILGLKPPPE